MSQTGGVIVVSQPSQPSHGHTVNPSLHPARFTAWPVLAQARLADELASFSPARPDLKRQISGAQQTELGTLYFRVEITIYQGSF